MTDCFCIDQVTLPLKNSDKMQMNTLKYGIAVALTMFCHGTGQAQFNEKSSIALIHRLIPDHAASFIVQELQGEGKADVFEIESKDNQIVLRGKMAWQSPPLCTTILPIFVIARLPGMERT